MTGLPPIGHTTGAHAETRTSGRKRSFDYQAAYDMWLAGMSYRLIGDKLDVDRHSAKYAVEAVMRELMSSGADVARNLIAPHGNGLPVETDGEVARNGHHRTNGAARSPQQPPPSHCPPPALANGVATNNSAVGEAGGLRGAPAGTVHPPDREGKEQILVEAGAPIVRRQHDDQGDLIYVVSLPAAHYVTHARSLVDELLQPFESHTVQWVNEIGDAA